jgi:hypothetical protein
MKRGSRAARIGVRVTLLGGGVIVSAAAAIVAMLFTMRRSWAPAPGFARAVVFWNERVPHAGEWWLRILVLEIVWSIALIALVAALLVAGIAVSKRFARTLLLGQVLLLGLFLAAPMPLDADQYAYVAYADLVNLRYSPYDPPLRRVALPRQLREVATVWSNDEGAADARKRVLIRDRYGPAFTLATAAVLRPFRGASLETQARVLRVLAALASLGVTLLLWGELQSRRSGLAALAAFALNPLVIMQTALGAHNDIVAVLLALAAYRFARREGFLGAAVCLGLSVAWKINFAPFIVPLLAFTYARSTRWRPAIVFAALVLVLAVPLVCALPFGWREALLRPYQDTQLYNASLLYAYAGAALARVPHAAGLAPFARHWLAPALIALGAVLVALRALRGRRAPLLEISLLLLLFTAARQQTWYALNFAPALLIPRRWAIGVFLGCSLASQLIQRKNFIGGWDSPPFIPFLIVATLLSAALALGFAALGAPRRAPSPDRFGGLPEGSV